MIKKLTKISLLFFSSVFLLTACSSSKNTSFSLMNTLTATISPSKTPTATLTPQPTSIPPTPTPEFEIGSTQVSPVDGMTMVFVPEGEFLMGSPEGVGDDNEHPQHLVNLTSYWIDQTEVTNAMFEKCVTAGACSAPPSNGYGSATRQDYYGNPEFADYPVANLYWIQAQQYCEWVDRSLPTEAQWEKAAKGTQGYLYPWGNEIPDEESTFIAVGAKDTLKVGSYPDGASPYGALDMAGNVWEWVEDVYHPYTADSVTNPFFTDPDYQTLPRVQRGGSWVSVSENTTTHRADDIFGHLAYMGGFGFRCALDPNRVKVNKPYTCEVGGSTTGSMMDQNGQPIKDYMIDVYKLTYFENVEPVKKLIAEVKTEADGSFSFQAPSCGDYKLDFVGLTRENQISGQDKDYIIYFDENMDFERMTFDFYDKVVNIPLADPIKIVFEKATTAITGQLLDNNNQPVEGEVVIGIRQSDGLLSHGISDGEGYFSVPVNPGEWEVVSKTIFLTWQRNEPSVLNTIIGDETIEPVILHMP